MRSRRHSPGRTPWPVALCRSCRDQFSGTWCAFSLSGSADQPDASSRPTCPDRHDFLGRLLPLGWGRRPVVSHRPDQGSGCTLWTKRLWTDEGGRCIGCLCRWRRARSRSQRGLHLCGPSKRRASNDPV